MSLASVGDRTEIPRSSSLYSPVTIQLGCAGSLQKNSYVSKRLLKFVLSAWLYFRVFFNHELKDLCNDSLLTIDE